MGWYQRQQQPVCALRVVRELGAGRAQGRMLTRSQAGGQLVFGQAVAGDQPFEEFERQDLIRTLAVNPVNMARSALPQQGIHPQLLPDYGVQFSRYAYTCACTRALNPIYRVKPAPP